ncbi:chromogranin-A [Pelodytes ibericus]
MAARMLPWGVLALALCAVQVMSYPVSSPPNNDDAKVMKCLVEVIMHTLSKPNPIPTSQICLEILRGDERIISILRHQNLLKELQELAVQGVSERVQKKGVGFEDEALGELGRQNNKAGLTDKSEEIPPETHKASSENGEQKIQPEEEKASQEQAVPGNSQEEENSAEELESNDLDKRDEEVPGDEEIDNHITDSINEMEQPRQLQDDAGHDSEEKESPKESRETDERRDKDKENVKEDGNENKEEEDNTQQDDQFDKGEAMSKAESSKEGGQPGGETTRQGGNSHHREPKSEEETSSTELEDSKRFNKMDELAKQLTSKKWVEESVSEEAPHQAVNREYDFGSHESNGRQPWHHSREDSSESGTQIAKRPDPEERKEEEGSANRKTEDQELESLAAIEAELEKVAHKLHELRRV